MKSEPKHICVCVCTYKRPILLKRLLRGLHGQETNGRFTFSIVIVDNDYLRSAEATVNDFLSTSSVPITYYVEPRQNISLARNKAVQNASGDFVAFIDDDEFPTKSWLLTLFQTCDEYAVDGVLGPVKPHFDEQPPRWVVAGGFYDRPSYPTGYVIDWTKGRTGNVLLKKEVFAGNGKPFKPEILTGEDQDFFGRMIEKGRVFIWCNEALAYEVVPPIRWRRTFILRRALLQGTISILNRDFGPLTTAKSVVAVPVYTAALPLTLVLGHHRFMSCLVKLCYHLGRLLALVDINPIREPYITE